MFEPDVYRQRRTQLAQTMGDGAVLLPAAAPMPRNYRDNVHPYRPNSHLLYYAGLRDADQFVLSTAAEDRHVLYGREATMDDVVWCGPRPSLDELAAAAGIDEVAPLDRLGDDLRKLLEQGVELHYLPPFQAEVASTLAELTGRSAAEVAAGASTRLSVAVAAQRLAKTGGEIAEIEDALAVTSRAYRRVMAAVREGMLEAEIAGLLQGVALSAGREQSFQPIATVRGEVLHNESRSLTLRGGQLLLIDSGAESPLGYASDITRTVPVSGRFDDRQRAIYEIVLATQRTAIGAMRPGVTYRDVHLQAARTMVQGLIAEGLMQGDPDEAVAAGAHALFFPHGLGHAMGLDVHDMEDLGDVVGYGVGVERAEQFGLNFLRFARTLREGYVMTVEPGIYFVPALIDRWADAGTCEEFIAYDALASWRNFGGIRIEDDLLVTDRGARVLGPPIPRSPEAVETAMSV